MEWLPDIAQADYRELARVHSPRVAEVVAVYWPNPDGAVWYCSTQADVVFQSPGGANLLTRPLEVRFKANQFLNLPIEDGISDSQIKLEFWDGDGAIADLHHRHGAGVRVSVFYWFPDESYLIEQWHGHLGEPEEEDGEWFRVSAAYGFRSALTPLPSRPFYDGCQAVHGPTFDLTQAEIDEGDCPHNLHLPGGTVGVAGSLELGPCPRRQRSDCTARLGDALSYLGFDAVADTYPNAGQVSKTRGNNNNRKRPLRVVYGPYVAKDLDLLGFSIDENEKDPENGWVQCLFAVSEGVVEYITDFQINGQYVFADQWEFRTGEKRQSKTLFSPNVGNYSGTALVRGRQRGDFRFANGQDLSGECRVGKRMNIRQWTDATTYTDGPTFNRSWVLLDAIRVKRWGYGLDPSRFVLQDFIDLATWCDQNAEYTDATGAVGTDKRSTFIGELLDKTAARHIYEICLAGNFTLPFPHRGKTRIMGLSQVPDLSAVPVFSDDGPERNIAVNDKGRSLLTTWKINDRELPNRVVVTFKDRELDNAERPLIFEDVAQQLKAGRSFGDRTRRKVEKTYDLLGVDREGQAIRLGNQLLDLGPLAGTTDDGPGLKNNRLIKFTTWFTHTLNCHKYQVIKVVSKKLTRYGFEYWRIKSINRLSDLKVEIEAVAYPPDYYEAINPLMIGTPTLVDGIEGEAYARTLIGAGGVPPYTWSLSGGTLPPGLTFNPSGATITGTPDTPGTYDFEITLTDSGGRTTTQFYALVIASAPPPPPPGGGSTLAGLQFEVTDATLPISIGLPVAETEDLLDLTNLRLRNASDVLVSASFKARERWYGLASDATKEVKVLVVDFTPNGTGVYTVETGTGNPAPASALTVTNASEIRVQAGNLDIMLAKTGNALLTSCKLSTVEQLSGTLPTLTVEVPVKSRLVQNTGASGAAAANVGQSFVTPEVATLFSPGQAVRFEWSAVFKGLNDGYQKAITFQTANPLSIGRNEFTPNHPFIFDQGGANEYVLNAYEYLWQTGYFVRQTDGLDGTGTPTDTFPVGMPVDVTIKDKNALDAGNYTISTISGGVVNLTGALTHRLLKNIEIVPVTPASPVTATLELQSATIREQNSHRVVIQQSGFFKLSGARLFADLSVDLLWTFYAGHSFAAVEIKITNGNQTMPAVVREAQFSELKLTLPLAVTATASSDDVLTNDGASSACARRAANTSGSTAVAGAFKLHVPHLAENHPARLVSTTSSFTWSLFPALSGVTHTFPKDRAKAWQLYLGQGADTAAKMSRDLRVKLNAAYVAASGVVRRAFAAPVANHTAGDWGGDAVLATAANRCEKQFRQQWDATANDPSAPLQWSHFERELSSHTYTGSGNDFGDVFGVLKFGQTYDLGDLYTQNRYDFVLWQLAEFLRHGDPKAFRLAHEHALHVATLGTIHSAIPHGGNQVYNQLGGAVYESSTDGLNGNDIAKYTHLWREGIYLYWALTGDWFVYDSLLLQRRFDRQGITANFASDEESYNQGRGLGWTLLALLAAYRHLGDAQDLTLALQAATALRNYQQSQAPSGVYVAPGYTNPSGQYGKQIFNAEGVGYAAFGLAELSLELDAQGTPNQAVRDLLIDAAEWAARGSAALTASQGNAPLIPSSVIDGQITPAHGVYDWFASGLRRGGGDTGVVGMLGAVGLLAASRYSGSADLLALAFDLFKTANLYQDSKATPRAVGTYDLLSYRRSEYYGSSDKVTRQTYFSTFPFLAYRAQNAALNPPTITSVAPGTLAANAGGTLTLTGTGFVAGLKVGLGGQVITPSNVSTTQIVLPVAANLLTAGVHRVLVTNPNGGQSNLSSLTIT